MSITLSGLTELGLGHLESVELFEKDKKKEEEKPTAEKQDAQARPEEEKAAPAAPKRVEKDYIFDKTFRCPVCDNTFTAKIMKTGYIKMSENDWDLRPRYDGIDSTKYDVIMCPKCGYATLKNYYGSLSGHAARQFRESIAENVHLPAQGGETYTYEQAMERYKMALATAVVTKAKDSEKSYICLEIAWLLRGYGEYLQRTDNISEDGLEMIYHQEEEYLRNAYEGFMAARESEGRVLGGLSEENMDYLLAALSLRFEKYAVAGNFVAKILRTNTSKRVREKALTLKADVIAGLKMEIDQKMQATEDLTEFESE